MGDRAWHFLGHRLRLHKVWPFSLCLPKVNKIFKQSESSFKMLEDTLCSFENQAGVEHRTRNCMPH